MNDTKKRIILAVGVLLAIIALLVFGTDGKRNSVNVEDKPVYNMTAKGGYYPDVIEIESDKPAILAIHTDNTYDCSGAISIPDLDIDMVLPPSGDTDIEIPSLKSGVIIKGGCTGSTHGFKIKVL